MLYVNAEELVEFLSQAGFIHVEAGRYRCIDTHNEAEIEERSGEVQRVVVCNAARTKWHTYEVSDLRLGAMMPESEAPFELAQFVANHTWE